MKSVPKTLFIPTIKGKIYLKGMKVICGEGENAVGGIVQKHRLTRTESD